MKASSSNLAQIITAVAAVVAVLYFLRSILAPFFLAALIMVVIHAITDAIVDLLPKVPHWIVMVLTGVVVSAVIIASVEVALHGLAELTPQAQQIVSRLQELLQHAGSAAGLAKPPDRESLFGNADLLAFVQGALTWTTGALSGGGLVILFLTVLLASRPAVYAKIPIIAGSSGRTERFNAVLRQVARGVRNCVLVQTLYAAMIAVGAGVVMFTLGLQNALFWTVVIFLLLYIPVLGGLAGSIAPALFALVQFPTIWQAVTLFVAIQSISIVVGNLVMPKIQAAAQNIDPVVGILAFSIWTLLWGLPGAILAAPLTVMMMIAFAKFETTRWAAVLISNDGKPAASLDAAAEPRDR
jgi:AI-2 transport protein TqsA